MWGRYRLGHGSKDGSTRSEFWIVPHEPTKMDSVGGSDGQNQGAGWKMVSQTTHASSQMQAPLRYCDGAGCENTIAAAGDSPIYAV